MPRAEHNISRADISDNALKVMYRLNNAGFEAYLVGGCVRDLMLGHKPKDFDVVTNATPEQIKGLFRNCRLIGRRFRLAHIVFGREIIEVATFRGHHSDDTTLAKQDEQGQLVRDNVFGSIEEDAERRDFTFNAMYYEVATFTVTDFAQGIKAINRREVDLIGDPDLRYREDPVRMLRAVRFAAKLDMVINPRTAKPIHELAHLLSNIPPARLFEEILKLFLSGKGLKTFRLLKQYKLLEPLFPMLAKVLNAPDSREVALIERVLENTDERVNTGQRVTPAFLIATLLWYPVEEHATKLQAEAGLNSHDAFNIAMGDVLHRQSQRIMIPKRFSTVVRDIWHLQQRLPRRFGRRSYQLLSHPKFRAGYDFLLARGETEGGKILELAEWWTQFQHAAPAAQKKMLTTLRQQEGGAPRKRRRPSKPRSDNHA
ncbi:MAG: polynucleotide adenylyltransferase PcnB [Alteromonadaceae bacterium]|nr:polynucleotide adenylyltransferase PcnB [Alteromonadaceae bacterium]